MVNTVRSQDGTDIAYALAGAGPPVVLVSGPLSDRSASVPLAEQLGDTFTVVTYDRRGRGASGDTDPYEMQREVEDLQAVIWALGAPAGIYGFSTGATLALKAAVGASGIAGLALHEPALALNDGEWAPTDLPEWLSRLIAAGRPGDAVTLFRLHAGLSARALPMVHAQPCWSTLLQMAQACVYDAALMRAGSFPVDDLSAVMAPALVMNGADTWTTQQWCGQLVADALPRGSHTLVSGTDDLQPGAVAACLNRFFSACMAP